MRPCFEAVVKQVKATRHPWLIACDANTSPEYFGKSFSFQSGQMFKEAPKKKVATCRSRGPQGEWIEWTYDCVIASQSQKQNHTDGLGGILSVEAAQSSVLCGRAGCQEEARKKKAEMKRRRRRTLERDESEVKPF